MSDVKTCPTCSAKFIGGKHFWNTGKLGNTLDLAGLVCNPFCKGRACINPDRGVKGGQTWEERNQNLQSALEEFEVHPVEDFKTLPEPWS
jgi:hypothetical protein